MFKENNSAIIKERLASFNNKNFSVLTDINPKLQIVFLLRAFSNYNKKNGHVRFFFDKTIHFISHLIPTYQTLSWFCFSARKGTYLNGLGKGRFWVVLCWELGTTSRIKSIACGFRSGSLVSLSSTEDDGALYVCWGMRISGSCFGFMAFCNLYLATVKE